MSASTTNDAMAMLNKATGQDEPIVLDGDLVRGRSETREYDVTGEQLAAYAAATRDTRKERLAGEVASPAFAFVPLTELLFDVAGQVAGTLTPTGLVHTHQRFELATPIAAGDRLRVDAHVPDLRASRFGGVVTIAADTSRADGTHLGRQVVTALVVGAGVVNPIEDPAYAPSDLTGAERSRPSGGTIAIAIDRDHPARYADASGDRNPIHLDPAFARAQGFPAPIVHGMCTLALTCHALEELRGTDAEPTALAIEFTRPVFPGDKLTVRHEEDPAGGFAFDVVNRKQRTVMRGGQLFWG